MAPLEMLTRRQRAYFETLTSKAEVLARCRGFHSGTSFTQIAWCPIGRHTHGMKLQGRRAPLERAMPHGG